MSSYVRNTKTANYTIVSGDLGKIIDVTSNSVTISLTAAATLGDGFYVFIRNSSSTATHVVTIDGNGSETIDGSPLIYLRRYEGIHLVCDGSGFFSLRTRVSAYQTNSSQQSHQLDQPTAEGSQAIALGGQSDAASNFSTAIGYQAQATNDAAVGIGYNATASGPYSVAIGYFPRATGSKSVALGSSAYQTKASGGDSVALGSYANAASTAALSGPFSYTSGRDSIAFGIGQGNTTYGAQGSYSAAIGQRAKTTASNSVAIGQDALASTANQIVLGGSSDTVKISSSYTLPSSDGSANQVLTTDGSGAVTFADAGGGADLYTANPVNATDPTVAGNNSIAIGSSAVGGASDQNNALAIGTSSEATRSESTAVGYNVTASGLYSMAFGGGATASGTQSISIGRNVTASGSTSVALGSQATSTQDRSTAIGPYAQATGAYSVALGGAASDGMQPSATGTDSIAIGGTNTASTRRAKSSNTGSVALGAALASGADSFAATLTTNSTSYGAQGTSSIAIGQNAKATGYGGKAIGFSTIASDNRATAIGAYATASGSNSLAISAGGNTSTASGYGSIAIGVVTSDATNSVAIGQKARTNGIIGSYKFSNGEIQSANDDCQTGTYLLKAGTTDATAKALTTNDNNTASTNNQIILTNYSAFSFSGTVVAREFQGDGSDYAAWEVKGTILRDANAGSTVLGQAVINDLYHTSGASAWDIALTADTTNGGLKISATGAASTNIRWVGTINTSEVRYEYNG